jgi:hypothetical protein
VNRARSYRAETAVFSRQSQGFSEQNARFPLVKLSTFLGSIPLALSAVSRLSGLRVIEIPRSGGNVMNAKLPEEIAALPQLSGPALRARYAELFGDATEVGNRAWLIRRIAWRLQARAEGGLSERARQRAAELANEADLRLGPPVAPSEQTPTTRTPAAAPLALRRADPRLPPPGSVLTRLYQGRTLNVTVLEHGFEYAGNFYASLSAVAKAITGSHCNGYYFFGLRRPKEGR